MRRAAWGMSVAVLLAFVAAACKSSVKGGQDTGGDPTSDAGSDDDAAVAADSGSPSGGLFTDPAVPHCAQAASGGNSVELHGLLDGQRVDDATILGTNLEASSFQVLEVVGGTVRFDMILTWTQPAAENRAIPLSGQSLIMREGLPFATQSFCITAGEFGSPALAPRDPGRTLLYRITGARRGDCAGPEVSVSLAGCSFRTNAYFPIATAVDAAADATGDRAAARDAPGQCLATGPSDAGAACNQFPITGPILGTQPLSVDDAGTANGPTGGAVGDGDYDLVGWLSAFQNYSRRSIHVFNGGTHIEWVAELDGSSPTMVIRANTRTTFAGSVLTIAGVDCMSNGLFLTQSYGYTASGDDLVLYNTDMNTGALQNIYTYRRTCARGP